MEVVDEQMIRSIHEHSLHTPCGHVQSNRVGKLSTAHLLLLRGVRHIVAPAKPPAALILPWPTALDLFVWIACLIHPSVLCNPPSPTRTY